MFKPGDKVRIPATRRRPEKLGTILGPSDSRPDCWKICHGSGPHREYHQDLMEFVSHGEAPKPTDSTLQPNDIVGELKALLELLDNDQITDNQFFAGVRGVTTKYANDRS